MLKSQSIFLVAIFIKFYFVSAENCDGEHEYLTDNQSCQQCEKCGKGFEPTQFCGYGSRDLTYSCKPCDSGTFSDAIDYKFCRTCKPCATWHAELRQACSSTSNALCGECFPNYYRLQKSDGSLDPECHKCLAESEIPECRRDFWNWWIIIIVVGGLILLFSVLAGFIWCKFCKGKQKNIENRNLELLHQASSGQETPGSEFLEPILMPICTHNKSSPKQQSNIGLDTYSNLPTAIFKQQYQPHDQSIFSPNLGETKIFYQHNCSTLDVQNLTDDFNSKEDVFTIQADTFDTDSFKNAATVNLLERETVA